ncbi:hypothetical protein, partial [Tsukamurella paurometabola]|uniref:hypothetical protein n=1 Tax=Tsukamurella paurometabola TaxID=2061 RepID=UPI001BB0B433
MRSSLFGEANSSGRADQPPGVPELGASDGGTGDGEGAADVVSDASPCSPGGSALPATQVAQGTDQSPFCHCSSA